MRFGVQRLLALSLAVAIGPLIHPSQFMLNGVGLAWLAGLFGVSILAAGLLWVNRSRACFQAKK